MGSWRSTISENIRVGFTTTNPKGFLLGFFSNISGEYLTMMVSNSGTIYICLCYNIYYTLFIIAGHFRVVFDFGFERQEVIFPNKHFGLGQYHDVRLSRKNAGSTLVLKVFLKSYCNKNGLNIFLLYIYRSIIMILWNTIST